MAIVPPSESSSLDSMVTPVAFFSLPVAGEAPGSFPPPKVMAPPWVWIVLPATRIGPLESAPLFTTTGVPDELMVVDISETPFPALSVVVPPPVRARFIVIRSRAASTRMAPDWVVTVDESSTMSSFHPPPLVRVIDVPPSPIN